MGGDIQVTAVEINPEIAKIYQYFFPQDIMIIGDAHQYLLEHFNEFDFIWSSPPCPTHSGIRKVFHNQNPPVYPDMKLYEEILLLQGYFSGKWVVENVIGWYEPLIKPFVFREHYYWSNFVINGKNHSFRGHWLSNEELAKHKGVDLSLVSIKSCDIKQVLRNCVEPDAGKFVFDCAFRHKQKILGVDF